MALTKSKGDMYRWVTHTWNPIKGQCQFKCDYCYVPSVRGARFFEGESRLDEKELKTHLGRGKIIFVGSMCDMWGSWISSNPISRILDCCSAFPENEYVFQSKDPKRFLGFEFGIGKSRIRHIERLMLGTTIETDCYPVGFYTKAPIIDERICAMTKVKNHIPIATRFVTIEPIMKFNLIPMIRILQSIQPEFVTIGADSKSHNLQEPSWKEVEALVSELSKFTEIRQKSNLDRLKK